MPYVSLPIPETETTVLRPIVFEIVRDVARWTHLELGSRVLFNEDQGAQLQTGSSLQDKANQEERMVFDNDKALTVTMTMEATADTALNGGGIIPGGNYIWLDKERDVFLRPGFKNQQITLSVSYRAGSREAALAWRNGIADRVGQNREGFVHEPTYSYQIPEELMFILRELHRLRENVAGYGDTFDEYFEANGSNELTIATNQSGEQYSYRKREKTTRVVGWFDFDTVPEKGSRSDNATAWDVSFGYVFLFSLPTEMAMRYPIVMHNQLLSSMYRDAETDDQSQSYPEALTFAQVGLRYFEGRYANDYFTVTIGRRMPVFDDYHPRFIVPSTIRVVTALCKLRDTAVGTILGNLSDFRLKQHFYEFIHDTEYKYMTEHYKSIFQVQLYINGNMMNPSFVGVDDQLNVYAKKELDFRNEHRIRFSIVGELKLLDPDALDRLLDRGDVFKDIAKGLWPEIVDDIEIVYDPNAEPKPGPGYVVKDDDWYSDLIGGTEGFSTKAIGMRTVQTLFLVTNKGDGQP